MSANIDNSHGSTSPSTMGPRVVPNPGDGGDNPIIPLGQRTAAAPTTSQHRRRVSDDSSNSDSDIAKLDYINDDNDNDNDDKQDDGIKKAWKPPLYRDTRLLAKTPATPKTFSRDGSLSNAIVDSVGYEDCMELDQAETKTVHHRRREQEQEQQRPLSAPAVPATLQEPVSPLRFSSSPPPVFTPPRSSIPRPRSLDPPTTLGSTTIAEVGPSSPAGSASSGSSSGSSGRLVVVTTKRVVALKPTDVVCGRGAPTSLHPGNRAYQKVIRKNAMEYLCSARSEKPAMAHRLMEDFRAGGIRFVKRERNPSGAWVWVPLGTDKTYDKVCQSLREGAPRLRRRLMQQAAAAAAAAGETKPKKNRGKPEASLDPEGTGGGNPPNTKEALRDRERKNKHEKESNRSTPSTPIQARTRARERDADSEEASPVPSGTFETGTFESASHGAFDSASAFGDRDGVGGIHHQSHGHSGECVPPIEGFAARYETHEGTTRDQGYAEYPWHPGEAEDRHRFHRRRPPVEDGNRHRNYYTYNDVRVPYYVHLPPHLGGERLFADRVFRDNIEYEE